MRCLGTGQVLNISRAVKYFLELIIRMRNIFRKIQELFFLWV